MIPVNRREAGSELLGETVHADLKSIQEPLQMVDIFRNAEAAGVITDEAIVAAKDKGIDVVWMQLGIRNDTAAARAEAAGLTGHHGPLPENRICAPVLKIAPGSQPPVFSAHPAGPDVNPLSAGLESEDDLIRNLDRASGNAKP